MLGAISPLLAGAVNYLGAARRRVPIAIAAVLVNAAIDVALLEEIGIIAGAIGTDVAYTLYVGAHLWLLHQLVGMRLMPWWRRCSARWSRPARWRWCCCRSAPGPTWPCRSCSSWERSASVVYFAVLVLVGQVSPR